jgi:hypothetical protein
MPDGTTTRPSATGGGDGNCSYYNNPDGDSIMIGDC